MRRHAPGYTTLSQCTSQCRHSTSSWTRSGSSVEAAVSLIPPIVFPAMPSPQDLTFARLSGIGGQPDRARLGLRRVTRRLLFASLGLALLAVNDGLTEVVRGSLTGSVVSNLLLVLGLALVAGDRGKVDRRSTFLSLGLLAFATLLFLVPAIPGWHGDPNRDSL